MPSISDQTFLHLSDLHLANTLDGLSYDVQAVGQLHRVLAAARASDERVAAAAAAAAYAGEADPYRHREEDDDLDDADADDESDEDADAAGAAEQG